MQNMYVRHGNPDGNGNDIVYTLRVNGIASVLTVTLASTATQGSDNVNTVSITQGDNLDIEVTKASGVGNSPDEITVTMEFL